MFRNIFVKELKSHLSQLSFYIFVAVMFFFVYLYAQNTNPNHIVFNLTHGKEFNVAAVKIAKMFTNWTIAGIFFVMLFVGRSVVKDFQVNIHDFFFTTGIKKWEYLGGRFFGAFITALLAYLIIPVAVFIGNLSLSQELQGPLFFETFARPYFFIVLPNILLISSFIFAISTLSRQAIYAYMSSIILIILYIVLILGTTSLKNPTLRILIDPFGMNALTIASQYWTVNDLNQNLMPINSLLIINRLISIALSALCLILTYKKFTLTHNRLTASKKTLTVSQQAETKEDVPQLIIKPNQIVGSGNFKKISSLVFLEWKRILIHPAFLILFALGMMQWISNVMGNMDGSGTQSEAYTSWLLSQSMHLWMYMVPITILFGGLIVWREKDHKTQDIYHTLPLSDAQRAISKIFAIFGMQVSYLFFSIIVGALFQIIAFQHFDIQLDLYFQRLFGMELLNYFQLTILVVLIQIAFRNKILGFFISSVLFIFDLIFIDIIKWDIPYLRFAHFPSFTYSNINEYGPYQTLLINYGIYWFLFSILILMLCIFLWKSSENDQLIHRVRYAFKKTRKSQIMIFSSILILFLIQGANILYNRFVLNDHYTQNATEKEMIQYEKQCLPFMNYPQVSVTEVNLNVDLFPKEQNADIRGNYVLKNNTKLPIDTLFISMWNQKRAHLMNFSSSIELTEVIPMKNYRLGIFRLNKPLNPGDSLTLNFEVQYRTKGFTDLSTETAIVQNGSLLSLGGRDNQRYIPQIGINKGHFISQNEIRKKYHLGKAKDLASIEKADRKIPFSNFDMIRYHCIVSTDKGQTAISNGELIKSWEKEDRSYFEYQPLIPISNELVIASAKYSTIKENYKGINLEIYYHEKHNKNLDRIISGFKTSIDLNSFLSKYPHKTLRIIETPAYMSYAAARAFPMMYVWNENSGFTSRVNEKKKPDQVFAISAHEMAHHWWGFEILPVEAEGLYFPIESMAEMMSTLALEKHYGKDIALKYVKNSREIYLKRRGKSNEDEVPVARCGNNQSHIAYQKGMIQLYALRTYIGNEAFNQGLKDFFDRFSSQKEIYPLSIDLVQSLRNVTPDSLKTLCDDLFMNITLYDFKIDKSSISKNNTDYLYQIQIKSGKTYADQNGKESNSNLNDYVLIALKDKDNTTKEQYFVKINQALQTITLKSKHKYDSIEINPNGLLIEKEITDNLYKIKN